jgi:hypothetical protein
VKEGRFGWRNPGNLMPGSEDKCSHAEQKEILPRLLKNSANNFFSFYRDFLPSKLWTGKKSVCGSFGNDLGVWTRDFSQMIAHSRRLDSCGISPAGSFPKSDPIEASGI